MILELKVEKSIIYIPVPEDTEGGTPILKSKGLKMAPPPRPRAPDTQPPRVANITSLVTVFFVNLRSESTKPFPTFSLSYYSLVTILIDRKVTKQHTAMNEKKKNHPRALQVLIPMIDLDVFPPLRSVTNS